MSSARSTGAASVGSGQLNTVLDSSPRTVNRQLDRVQEEIGRSSYVPPFRDDGLTTYNDVNRDNNVTDSVNVDSRIARDRNAYLSHGVCNTDAVDCGMISASCSPDSSDSCLNVSNHVASSNENVLIPPGVTDNGGKAVKSEIVNMTACGRDLMLGDATGVSPSANDSLTKLAADSDNFLFYGAASYGSQDVEPNVDGCVSRTFDSDSTFASGPDTLSSEVTDGAKNSTRIVSGEAESCEHEAMPQILHSILLHDVCNDVDNVLRPGRSTFKTHAMTQQQVSEDFCNVNACRGYSTPTDNTIND